MEVLDYPPKVDVQKLATQKKTRVEADGESARPTLPDAAAAAGRSAAAESQRVYFRLTVVRAASAAGPTSTSRRAPRPSSARRAASSLPGERFCHPREAAIRFRDGRLWLHDFEAGNGVFLRIKAPGGARARATSSSSATSSCASSATPTPQGRPGPGADVLLLVAQVALVVPRRADLRGRRASARASSRAARRCRSAPRTGDFVFPSDPLVSEQHCLIEEQAGDHPAHRPGLAHGRLRPHQGRAGARRRRRAPRRPDAAGRRDRL